MPDMEDLEDWAGDEFGGAQLGDARRTQRLVVLARELAQKAHVSFPQALSGAQCSTRPVAGPQASPPARCAT
ncbi:hypothetical protein IPF36_15885 [Cupriavidus sp. IK-TO18]|nr:hypothetical protein [Cupriavidus sp. IK-TO18]